MVTGITNFSYEYWRLHLYMSEHNHNLKTIDGHRLFHNCFTTTSQHRHETHIWDLQYACFYPMFLVQWQSSLCQEWHRGIQIFNLIDISMTSLFAWYIKKEFHSHIFPDWISIKWLRNSVLCFDTCLVLQRKER